MRANWDEDLPPAGIVDREEAEAKRYRGMNPEFVRRVWEKRRSQPSAVSRARKWTPEKKAIVAEMMMAGKSSGEIARKFGSTTSAIAGLVHCTPELREIGFQTAYAQKMRQRLNETR